MTTTAFHSITSRVAVGLRGSAVCVALALALGCSHAYNITVEPPDARLLVNGQPTEAGKDYITRDGAIAVKATCEGREDWSRTYQLGGVFASERITISLEKKKYPVTIGLTAGGLAAGQAECRIDGTAAGPAPWKGELEYGEHELVFSSSGAPDLQARIDVRGPGNFLFRLQTEALPIVALGVYPCGSQPKQVIFSPHDRFLYITLLNDVGFQIFDFQKKETLATVSVGPKPKLKGFPEGLFIDKYRAFFITQMSTNYVYEYTYADDGSVVYKRMFPSAGVFPKFLAYAPSLDLLAVSNWLTSDVTLFDYATGKAVKKIPGLATPRGLAFSPDDKFLYVTSYDGGNVFKFDTATWHEAARFYHARAAMRHLALDPARRRFFVDDMAACLVFELDMDTLALLHTYKTSWMPNTIALDSNGRFLFVSCRGPNNPVDYTLRSPQDSVVMIFDTTEKKLVGRVRGGNQPTGLDLSADDRYLAFTNFQDADFELYDISGLTRSAQ
jgi:DNA-binding beta-propeller fold protein YncE